MWKIILFANHKSAACVVAVSACISAYAQTTSLSDKVFQRIAVHEKNAAELGSTEVFQELERLRHLNSKKEKLEMMDEERLKVVGYAVTLEKRRMTGQPLAALYYGQYKSRECSTLSTPPLQASKESVLNCWRNVIESFKIAGKAEIAIASENVARMYESGLGVNPSKFVAAEWYLQAAAQYNNAGDREQALSSLESALTLVPELPAAERFKREMFK